MVIRFAYFRIVTVSRRAFYFFRVIVRDWSDDKNTSWT